MPADRKGDETCAPRGRPSPVLDVRLLDRVAPSTSPSKPSVAALLDEAGDAPGRSRGPGQRRCPSTPGPVQGAVSSVAHWLWARVVMLRRRW